MVNRYNRLLVTFHVLSDSILGVSAALSGAVLIGAFVLFKRLDKYFADVI